MSMANQAPARPATPAAILCLLVFGTPAVGYEQQIATQAQTIAEQLADSETQTLAVVDFTDLQGNVTELGRFLAEELSIELARLGEGVDVVDRTHLKALLEEHKLSATGLIDPTTARELGQIAGVGALVTGTVIPLGDSVRLAVKVLDTESARMVTSSTANIPKTAAIAELLRREIVTGDRNGVHGRAGNSSTATDSATVAGFRFRLRRCSLQVMTLDCALTVTNHQNDCELTITNVTNLVTEKGDLHEVGQITFRNRAGLEAVTKTLETAIPSRFKLRFGRVESHTKKLSLLEVAAIASPRCGQTGGNKKAFRVQFRDVRVYQ